MTIALDAQNASVKEISNRFPVIDTDVHPDFNFVKPEVLINLPERWQKYVAEFGAYRPAGPGAGERPRHREYSHRWDTEPPEGGQPMSNPNFAREQLLDKYDMTAALLNDIFPYQMAGGRNTPRELAQHMNRAVNDYREQHWFPHDDRWYGSINVPHEVPSAAVAEIQRRMDGDFRERWRQITIPQDNQTPLGHEMYWPIYEIACEYDLPIATHVSAGYRGTPSGSPTYYFEEHVVWAAFNFPTVSSLIFEGVFDRFPKLKFAFIEFGWSWAVPLAWRLDATAKLLANEVSHLERKPSEYIRDHFWFGTQPMEEPEVASWSEEVFGAFEASGMGNKLMFSSDYPHWDFDEPSALPRGLSKDMLRGILGGNASALYGIPLRPDSGVIVP